MYEEGKSAEDFLRRKSRLRLGQLQSSDEDSNENSGDELFGPNVLKAPNPQKDKKKKLRRRRRDDSNEDEGDEETARQKAEEAERRLEARRKKDEEKRKSIKSEVYIRDSDDEENEERDRVFFAKEKELRWKMGTIGVIAEAVDNTKKRKKRKKDNVGSRRKRIRRASNGNDTDATGDMSLDVDSNSDEEEEYLFVTTGSGEHDNDKIMQDISSGGDDSSTNAGISSARGTSPQRYLTSSGPSPALEASAELVTPRAKDAKSGYSTEGDDDTQHHGTSKVPCSLEDKEDLEPHSPVGSDVQENLDDSPPKPSTTTTTNRSRRRQAIMVSDDEE